MRFSTITAMLAATTVALGGCLLGSKAPTIPMHLVTVEGLSASTAPAASGGDGRPLRMGRASSASHLRHRLVYRVSERELSDYDDWRWTENPEEYLRRSLETSLFMKAGLARAVDGGAPTLDVELVAFEEVRRGAQRSGRVQAVYWLRGEHMVLAHGRVTSEKSARSPAPDDVVAAIASALDDVTAQVTGAVVLGLPPGPP